MHHRPLIRNLCLAALLGFCLAACSTSQEIQPQGTAPQEQKTLAPFAKDPPNYDGLLDPRPWKPDPSKSFPAWSLCQKSSECVAIEGRCREWEFVNRRHANKRRDETIRRRRGERCLDIQDYQAPLPAAACVHGVCAPAELEKPETTNCEDFRAHLDHIVSLGNNCEEHSDCERSPAHCSTQCSQKASPKNSRPVFEPWRERYASQCGNCQDTCIDPTHYGRGAVATRCVQKRCVLVPMRTHFQSGHAK